MTKYIPTVLAVIVAVLGTLAPQIQDLIQAHPAIALYAAALGTIAAHFAPQPQK